MQVRAFCASAGIEMCDGPNDAQVVTAKFFEEASNEPECLSSYASQRDLALKGRARQKQGLAPETLEYIMRNSQRTVPGANGGVRS